MGLAGLTEARDFFTPLAEDMKDWSWEPNLGPCDVKGLFTALDEATLLDPARMEEVVLALGVNADEGTGQHIYPDWMHGRPPGLRIYQAPREFAALLCWVGERAAEIETYLECGTYYGGSFYVVDQYLRRLNPGFQGSVGLDPVDKMQDWAAYHAQNPTTEFLVRRSVDHDVEWADLVFLDADKAYTSIRADFAHFKDRCRWLAVHDVANRCCTGVVEWWHETKDGYRHWDLTARYAECDNACGTVVIETGAMCPREVIMAKGKEKKVDEAAGEVVGGDFEANEDSLPHEAVATLTPGRRGYRFLKAVDYAPTGQRYGAGETDDLADWDPVHVRDALRCGQIGEA